MKLSVIVPSRLAVNPASHTDNLYLDRALTSIQRQTDTSLEVEVIVALDERPWSLPLMFERKSRMARGLPARFHDGVVRTVAPPKGHRGQAAAVNAGMKAATGELLAILEDDDQWYPEKLAYQLPLLKDHDFASCNQREVDVYTNFQRVNNFATPSGWLMKREVWEKVGPMDETFKWHVDTEWLGRLNRTGLKRVHLINSGERDPRGWLPHIAKHSEVVEHLDVTEPLVARTVNPDGGMSRIAKDPEAAAESETEHQIMLFTFGEVPW